MRKKEGRKKINGTGILIALVFSPEQSEINSKRGN